MKFKGLVKCFELMLVQDYQPLRRGRRKRDGGKRKEKKKKKCNTDIQNRNIMLNK